jgi:thiol-disulfide isomerase/thioredoxin
MHERRRLFVLLATGAALVGFHAWAKPRPDSETVQQNARMFSGTQAWQDRVAPDFELTLGDGTSFRLQDHIGKQVILLNFFATWCGPCRAEMPELEQFYRAHAADGMVLVGIDAQEKHTAVDAFVREVGVSFPVGIDGTGDLEKLYDVSGYPTTVVIGADGRVKVYQSGAIANADVALGPAVTTGIAAIRDGKGITADAYRQAQSTAQAPAASPSAAPLTGRARHIAEAMTCPCGCDDKVGACACDTAKSIRQRLAQGGYDGKTDEEVMQALNREFCVKGS